MSAHSPQIIRRRRSIHQQTGTGWLFVAPFTVLLVAFLILPLGYAFKLSLYRSTLIGGTVFSGLGNYQDVWADPEFRRGVVRVLLFGLVQTPVMIAVALIAALMVDAFTSRFTKLFRLAMFAPYAVPVAIGALMWGYLYSPDLGPLHADLLTEHLALISMGNIVTWQWAGYNMIILYAALQGLPREVLEAARVDGAGPVRLAWSIQLPMIRKWITYMLVLSVAAGTQLFVEPELVSQASFGIVPNSYSVNQLAYQFAFTQNDFNGSAAISIDLLIVALVFAGLFVARGRLFETD